MLCNAELDSVRCLEMAIGHLQRLLADACGPLSSRSALLTAVLRSLHALQRALTHLQESDAASELVLAAAEGTCCFNPPFFNSPCFTCKLRIGYASVTVKWHCRC